MAIPLAAILKAMPVILDATGSIMASVRNRRDAPVVKTEERIRKIEDDLLAIANTLAKVAEEIQSVAQTLAGYTALLETQQRKVKLMLWTAGTAAMVSLVAAGLVLAR